MTSGLEKSDSRMVIGARGIEMTGAGVVDNLSWALQLADRLRTNRNALVMGVGDGLFFGPPVFGPPPEYKVLRRLKPGLKPSHNWKYLGRAQNLAGFGLGGVFLEFDDFTKGVAWGFWSELTGLYELGRMLLDGSLGEVARTAIDTLLGKPDDAYRVGQLLGGAMIGDLMEAAEGDFNAFVYKVGELLGSFLLDIVGALFTGGIGPIAKLEAKALFKMSKEAIDAAETLARRARPEFDRLMEGLNAAAKGPMPGLQPAYGLPGGPAGPPSPRWLEPMKMSSSRRNRGTGPRAQGTSASGGASGGSGPSAPGGGPGTGRPGGQPPGFSVPAATAGGVGTRAAANIPGAARDLIQRTAANMRFHQRPIRDALSERVNRIVAEQLDPDQPSLWRDRVNSLYQHNFPGVWSRQFPVINNYLRANAVQWVRDVNSFRAIIHDLINQSHDTWRAVGGQPEYLFRRSDSVLDQGRSTLSLTVGWSLFDPNLRPRQIINANDENVDDFLRNYHDEVRHLFPRGFELGRLGPDKRFQGTTAEFVAGPYNDFKSREGEWHPEIMYEIEDYPRNSLGEPFGLHAEILGVTELDEAGYMIGAVATSLPGCGDCVPQIRINFPGFLHLDPGRFDQL